MISLVKILTESPQWDADDYIPYDDITVGTIVHCTKDSDDMCKVLEKLGDKKLIVSLIDDPRDIRGAIYDEDVIAHVSDQNSEDVDDPLDEISGGEAGTDPEAIISKDEEVIASGKGFNISEITEGLRKSFEIQAAEDEARKLTVRYAYLDIRNNPAEITTRTIDFCPTGKYMGKDWSGHDQEHTCNTIEEAAKQVEKLLKEKTAPKELANHIEGWMITQAKFRPGLYPMLDPEGVQMYIKAEKDLSDDVHRFYRGSNYWGD